MKLISMGIATISWIGQRANLIAKQLCSTAAATWSKRWRQIQALDRHYRLYWYAAPSAILGFIFVLADKAIWLANGLSLVAGLTCSCGFLMWVNHRIRPYREAVPVKVIIAVVHVIVLAVAAVGASNVVSKVLDLPANYFTLTVGAVALLAYVPTYLVLIAFACLGFAGVAMSVAFFCFLISWMLHDVSDTHKQWIQKSKAKSNEYLNKAAAHFTGAIAVALFAGFAVDRMGELSMHTYGAIRLFAYWADFQPPGKYPCLPADTRIRLEDNGIVTLAKRNGFNVEFTTIVYKAPDPDSLQCPAKAVFQS